VPKLTRFSDDLRFRIDKLSSDVTTSVIQHVARTAPASELQSCVAFYRLLGFDPVPVPRSLEGRAVWLTLGAIQLHLLAGEHPGPDQGHVAILAGDYAATLARLRAAGHVVEARREHWGSPRCYVADPAGNLVELMERAPS
jgi:catechol 2,3-dioxygenase-like lactoylglutathione lyase family enzyme